MNFTSRPQPGMIIGTPSAAGINEPFNRSRQRKVDGLSSMIFWGAALLLTAVGGAETRSEPESMQFAQLTVRQQIIVRMPMRGAGIAPPPSSVRWKEAKGPKCIAARSIAGAMLLGRNSVDLVLRNNSRVRARLENSCPALDYYNGFYITPGTDGMICADRDSIRSRVGGMCEIDAFRTLTAAPDD